MIKDNNKTKPKRNHILIITLFSLSTLAYMMGYVVEREYLNALRILTGLFSGFVIGLSVAAVSKKKK